MSSSKQPGRTRIPRYAAQMDPQDLSPLTAGRGVVLHKPRRRETQMEASALARASALLHSPTQATTMPVTPSSSSSSGSSRARQKVHQHLLLQHFAALDIEMVYDMADEEEAEAAAAAREKERADSVDMADIFYSEH